MAQLQLSKAALGQAKIRLAGYRRFLPSLELKRRQLIAERNKARQRAAEMEARREALFRDAGERVPMLAFAGIGLDGLSRIKSARYGRRNVVGVMLPVVDEVEIETRDYGLLVRPHWVDRVAELLTRSLRLEVEIGVSRQQVAVLDEAVKKVTQRGNFSQCDSTCVYPSPRPSDRVPFGTGPVVSRLSKGNEALLTYDPRPFGMIRAFFAEIVQAGGKTRWDSLPDVLKAFLTEQGFDAALAEIRANSASPAAFRKRFWRWFNMFRIMKFLHFARERGYPDIPVEEAASELLRIIDPGHAGIPSLRGQVSKLLVIYRMLEMR